MKARFDQTGLPNCFNLAIATILALLHAGTALGETAAPAPRTLVEIPGTETVLINKEVQGGLGRERYTIQYAPSDRLVANVFNPDTGATAFIDCEEIGREILKDNVAFKCRTKTPSDKDFVNFSYPPNDLTYFPKSFLGAGTAVLRPFPRGTLQSHADCTRLAGRLPKVVTRILSDCYASTAASSPTNTPDYTECGSGLDNYALSSPSARSWHSDYYRDLADAGCFEGSVFSYPHPEESRIYDLIVRDYERADRRARALDRWIYNGDGTATDTTTGLQWEIKTDDDTIHDKDDTYTWCRTDLLGNCDNPLRIRDGSAFLFFLEVLNQSYSDDSFVTTDNCFAGHCDWRLPTLEELRGIVDDSVVGCGNGQSCTTIPGATLPSSWSSTSDAFFSEYAWSMNFVASEAQKDFKSLQQHVRAVRGESIRYYW